MADYQGDVLAGQTLRWTFNTQLNGAPITLGGSPSLAAYKDGNTTESTAGLTITVDFDGKVGTHLVVVDTSADGTFYSSGSDFALLLAGTPTVNGTSVVGITVGEFSIQHRYMRGTDSAALAITALSTATWTGARAGYLDNLIAGILEITGDFQRSNVSAGQQIGWTFNTKLNNAPITLAGSPVIAVYRTGSSTGPSTSESTTGISLTVNYDSRTGHHSVVIDTSVDSLFYLDGDYAAVLTAGTINGISAVGAVVGRFTVGATAAYLNFIEYFSIAQTILNELIASYTTPGSVGQSFTDILSALTTIAGYIDTEVAAIKLKTDNLPSDPADQSLIIAATNAIMAAIAALNNLAPGAAMTLTSGERTTLAGVLLTLADGIENGYSLQDAQRIMLSVAAGKLSGVDTNAPVFRDVNDTKDRVTATTAATGRTSVTVDPS